MGLEQYQISTLSPHIPGWEPTSFSFWLTFDLTWLGSWFNFSSTSPLALILASSFHMLVNNIISLGACIVPSNKFPLFSVTEEKRGKKRGGERALVSMFLSTMHYDQLGTKPGHEAMTRSLDTKSLWIGSLWGSSPRGNPAVRIFILYVLISLFKVIFSSFETWSSPSSR